MNTRPTTYPCPVCQQRHALRPTGRVLRHHRMRAWHASIQNLNAWRRIVATVTAKQQQEQL